MAVTLTTISEADAGRTLELQTGETAVVGRGEVADVPFPKDWEMSTRHFQIEGRQDCGQLTDLASTNGTFVNGQRISEASVSSGDVILAGQTSFSVVVGQAAQRDVTSEGSALKVKNSFDAPAVAVCSGLSVTEDAAPLMQGGQTVGEFVEELRQSRLYMDALRVLSRAMGTEAALLWSVGCIKSLQQDQLSKAEVQALDAAAAWAANGSQETAREAYYAANRLGNEGPAAMLALAAYWGTGNMSPPEKSPLPTADELPSQAIAGALTLVAVDGPPKDAAGKYQSFIEKALSQSGD